MHLKKFYPDTIVPLLLTFAVFAFFVALLFGEIKVLNLLVIAREPILIRILLSDVLIGMTIYLKTSIDFAIFIGRLMNTYPGWKNRVMIEIGTAAGNALGTFAILIIWDVFREVRFLMAAMIVLAALVLIRMAEDGLEHARTKDKTYPVNILNWVHYFEKALQTINKAVAPVLSRLIPNLSVSEKKKITFKGLFLLSFTVPFILGLDDFAGYIPLFNVVNVFGFATGVFLGHTILNIFLFLSPQSTIRIVKNPIISLIGSVAFVALAVWGIVEAIHLVG